MDSVTTLQAPRTGLMHGPPRPSPFPLHAGSALTSLPAIVVALDTCLVRTFDVHHRQHGQL
jgi:hypothetical protein